MLAKWLRKYIGGVRLSITLLVILPGGPLVVADAIMRHEVTPAAWGYLSALLVQAVAFVWKDTDRPTNPPPDVSPGPSGPQGG